jgi:hypothetical protein
MISNSNQSINNQFYYYYPILMALRSKCVSQITIHVLQVPIHVLQI